jgi:hypothetical protein
MSGPALAQATRVPRDDRIELAPPDTLRPKPGLDAEMGPSAGGGGPRRVRPGELTDLGHPTFLEPFTVTIPAACGPSGSASPGVRVGLSTWVVAPAPFDRRDVPATLALGLSVAWPMAGASDQVESCARAVDGARPWKEGRP